MPELTEMKTQKDEIENNQYIKIFAKFTRLEKYLADRQDNYSLLQKDILNYLEANGCDIHNLFGKNNLIYIYNRKKIC